MKINKDGRRKYTIDNSVILIMQNSSIKCSQISDTNIKLNKSTLYRYINKDLDLILYNSAIKLAKFYGYKPVFRDKMFFFGDRIMIDEIKKTQKEKIKLLEIQVKRYKSQLAIIRETLNMEVIC
jgi:hypothetical protein